MLILTGSIEKKLDTTGGEGVVDASDQSGDGVEDAAEYLEGKSARGVESLGQEGAGEV